jgi:hypothetical protein
MAVETLRENTFSHSGDKKTFYWVSVLPRNVQSPSLLSMPSLEHRSFSL